MKKDEGKNKCMQKLLETSQVMYWFGLACTCFSNVAIFSIYPPDFYGIHCSIFAYISLILAFFLHLFAFLDKKAAGRTLWAVFYVLYMLSIMLWFIFTAIIGAIWTEENYSL